VEHKSKYLNQSGTKINFFFFRMIAFKPLFIILTMILIGLFYSCIVTTLVLICVPICT